MRQKWLVLTAALTCTAVLAQVPPAGSADHESMLASDDPVLAANKRLIYDWWREVFEAGHTELNERYMAADFIEHNPNVRSGREGVEAFIRMRGGPRPVQDRIEQELIDITAERDIVTLMFVVEYDHPERAGEKYKTTWYDTFRVRDGRIVEHWDPATIE